MAVMDRETSHRQACSSYGMDCRKPPNYSPVNHVSPRPSHIQRNLSELSLSDLLQLAKQLKYPSITTLRLSVSAKEQLSVSQFFGSADQRTTDTLFAFTRALAHAIEGWMQTLELGLCLGLRDINTLCPAIRSSRTLRHLSFANSGLGDVTLQMLSSCLQNCQPLQTLNLSGCALTDVSTAVVTAIVKGGDPNALSAFQSPKKAPPAEHRAPKYGQQWRQNVILRGKWSPAPDPGDTIVTPITEGQWQDTLRKPMAVGVIRHDIGIKPTKPPNAGRLVALDLSCNSFTDALSEELCPLLYKKPPLRALNLRCNQMTRAGAKPLLDVMKDLNILRLVDVRGNSDDSLLGVLENGEHYTTFSTFQSPFWTSPESLDPVICDSTKSQSNTPANQSRLTSRRSSMPEKQSKPTIMKGGAGSHHMSPQRSTSKTQSGGSRNITPSRRNKTPPKLNNSTSPSRANMSPCCSGASVSRTPAELLGPSSRQRRYHCTHQGSPFVHHENEDMAHSNDHNRRYISAPVKERPRSSARISPLRPAWPEKTTFDQTSQKHTSPSRDQDFDGRFMSPRALEPPREHPILDNTTLHEFDIRDMHSLSKVSDGLVRRNNSYEGPKRAQSAGYNIRRPGYLRDFNNPQDLCREYGHQNCFRNFSTSESPSRPRWPSTIHNQGRGRSRENRSPVIRCHHRCKLLNDVQEQKRSRSRVARAFEDNGHMSVFQQFVPKVAPLPDDKKELVEWNNFVNQMTNTLLNLKDGLDQLIGPTEGAVAQQAATKLNQMPSSFFRSGMLRLLERSCKVLNSHVTSLTRRHKDTMRHINGTENQAPVVNGEIPKKKKGSKVSISQEAVAKLENQLDKSEKVLQNVKHLGVHNSNQQHRMIYHPNIGPPLTTSKGNDIPQATK
ncbi:hypothetical protein M758_2G235000 [Ceratodon purpureus]|nr:hypothetical protein M758_2G235000 [Ceratodon purpureus]